MESLWFESMEASVKLSQHCSVCHVASNNMLGESHCLQKDLAKGHKVGGLNILNDFFLKVEGLEFILIKKSRL